MADGVVIHRYLLLEHYGGKELTVAGTDVFLNDYNMIVN